MPQVSQTRFVPTQQRAAAVSPSTFNAEAKTVEVVWTTGARGLRRDFWTNAAYEEELDVSPASVDMSRMNNPATKAPVLNGHEPTLANIIGVVERAWIANGEGRAVLRLSDAPEHAGIVRNIESGIISNISVGYDHLLSKRTDLYGVYMSDQLSGLGTGNNYGAGVRHRF